MAVKKKKKPGETSKSTGGENYFTISIDKKKKILGIFIIVFSILVLLSIISYSRFDKANLNYNFSDLFKVFNPDAAFREKILSTRNWLGVFGAYISDIFINSTLGIFAAVFPVIFLIWGIRFFLKINFRTLIHSSNFLLVLGLLTLTFFGVLRSENYAFREYYELSGNIGYYLGEVLGRLLGGAGSIIFLTAVIIIVLIIAFDIKIEKLFHFIKNIFSSSAAKIKEEMERSKEKPVEDKNLQRLKELNEEKKRGKKKSSKEIASGVVEELTAQELMKRAADDYETQIRIIRKDEKPAKIEENKIVKEESKKVDLKETGELNSDGIDKDSEARLPDQWTEKINYKFPGLDMLDPAPPQNFMVAEEELKRNAELLKEKLKLFDIQIDDISVTPGPVVTLYEIVPAPGVKISRIVGLEHDIALALAARGIRIIAPIPGKSAIGVEIPNAEATLVNARSVLARINESKAELPIALGKTINGDVYITDLAKMPHMLIAGSTGSGKSVGINMLIVSLLYSKHPADVKLIMIDPKKIELSFYNKLRRHYLAVSPDLDEE